MKRYALSLCLLLLITAIIEMANGKCGCRECLNGSSKRKRCLPGEVTVCSTGWWFCNRVCCAQMCTQHCQSTCNANQKEVYGKCPSHQKCCENK